MLGLVDTVELQIFSLTQFEKTPVITMFENKIYTLQNTQIPKQLTMFDLWWDRSDQQSLNLNFDKEE